MLTRRLFSRFPNFKRHRDAVFMIMRESTRLARRRAPRDQVPAHVEGGLHVLRVLRLRPDEGGRAEGARGGHRAVK